MRGRNQGKHPGWNRNISNQQSISRNALKNGSRLSCNALACFIADCDDDFNPMQGQGVEGVPRQNLNAA